MKCVAVFAIVVAIVAADFSDLVEEIDFTQEEASAQSKSTSSTCYVHPSDISCSTGGAGRNWKRVGYTYGVNTRAFEVPNSVAGMDTCASMCKTHFSSDTFLVECPHIDAVTNEAKFFCGCQSVTTRATTAITKTMVGKPGKVDEKLCQGSNTDKTFWYINAALPNGRDTICTGDANGKYITSGYAMGAADVGAVYKVDKETCPSSYPLTTAPSPAPPAGPTSVPDTDIPAGCKFRNPALKTAAEKSGFCSDKCQGIAAGTGMDFGSWTSTWRWPTDTKAFGYRKKKAGVCANAKCNWCICSKCPECAGHTRPTNVGAPSCSSA